MAGESKVLSLLVEDDEDQAKYTQIELEDAGATVIVVHSKREALKAVRSHPAFDLAICDDNLDKAKRRDRGGIDVAEELRRVDADLTIVGYSSKFAEDEMEEDGLFTFCYGRFGGLSEDQRRSIYQQWLQSASISRVARLEKSKAKLEAFLQSGIVSDRAVSEELSSFMDPEIDRIGYRLKIIEPGQKRRCISGGSQTIAHPIPIWIYEGEDAIVVELYRFPILFGSGNTEAEAIDSLFYLLDGYSADMEVQDDAHEDSPMVRQLSRYLVRILGSGNRS